MTADPAPDAALLSVRNLSVDVTTRHGTFRALHGIDLDVRAGRVLGIVGESGSGKSLTALSLLRLLPEATIRIAEGRILFDGTDITQASESAMRRIRGRQIAMIFQDPSQSLNPLLSVGRQIREPLQLHLGLGRAAAKRRAESLLDLVKIPSPRDCLERYPHELSGGQRQRVMIAIALSCHPRLLVADEPTTALDVTTQAQILSLLRDLQRDLDMAVVLITHDLGVVAEFADDVHVMYAGRVVERAPAIRLFAEPRHPYSEGLLRSMPALEEEDPERLPAIPGMVASPFAMPEGCAFHPRCIYAWDACRRGLPPLEAVGRDHAAACLRNHVDKVAA